MIGPEQCDMLACTREARVYSMCTYHAPAAWVESAIEEGLIERDQVEGGGR